MVDIKKGTRIRITRSTGFYFCSSLEHSIRGIGFVEGVVSNNFSGPTGFYFNTTSLDKNISQILEFDWDIDWHVVSESDIGIFVL